MFCGVFQVSQCEHADVHAVHHVGCHGEHQPADLEDHLTLVQDLPPSVRRGLPAERLHVLPAGYPGPDLSVQLLAGLRAAPAVRVPRVKAVVHLLLLWRCQVHGVVVGIRGKRGELRRVVLPHTHLKRKDQLC